MDIEEAKKEFKIIIDTVREIFKQDVKEDDEDIYEIDGRQFLAIETALNELEKKDKVIDLIVTAIISDKKILNLVCNKIINKTDEECEKQNLLCDDCIKQYFYKKAEEK